MIKKILLITLTCLLLTSLGGVTPVFANDVPLCEGAKEKKYCNPESLLYTESEHWWDLNIIRTVHNFQTGIWISMFANVTGLDMNEAAGCEEYFYRKYGLRFSTQDCICGFTEDDRCGVIENAVKMGELQERGVAFDPSYQGQRGSLLGIAYSVEEFNMTEPPIVNLAYFWNKNVSRLPIVGKTFAVESTSISGFDLPLLDAAYSVWEFSRNVALAFMSVILLYTGIMIMMRKKINPQLVVSVQYAIPKIIIGLLLIIFSYPIGATIVGVSWGLFRGSFVFAFKTYLEGGLMGGGVDVGKLGGLQGIGPIFLAIIIGLIRSGVFANAVAVLLVLVATVCALLFLVVQLKALIIYFKMVICVITAPLEMAMGTVPGSEERITDWFKRMAKYGLSVFAMGLCIPIIIILAYIITIAYGQASSASVSAETSGMGYVLRPLVPAAIVIYGFVVALSIEKTVGSFFGDDKFKKKK